MVKRKYSYDVYDIYDRPMILDLPYSRLNRQGRKAKRKSRRSR